MTIRIGTAGGGTFGELHLQTFSLLQRQGRCVLAGLADPSEAIRNDRAEKYGVRTYSDVAEMIDREKLDAVTVATPDPAHLPVVLAALEAGCHVFVEKPMDVTVEGCRAMVDAARAGKRLLQVDFHKRFDPFHAQVREAVADGRIGEPLYGYAWMEDRIEVPSKWFPGWAPQSSPAWFLGSHMVDLFRWMTGGPRAVRVLASGARKRLRSMGVDTWDCLNAKIEFEGGVSFALDTSWVLPDGFEAVVNQGIRLVGTEGIAEIDSQDRGAAVCYGGATQQTINPGFQFVSTDPHGNPRYVGYGYDSIADFADNVNFLKEGGTLDSLAGRYPDGEDGLEVTRILCAIHESAETGAVVTL